MKKVSIIGTVGIPASYGGFETLTEYLVKELNDKFELTVFCSKKSYAEYPTEYNGAKLEYINLKANGIQSIPYDIISIFKALKKSDILLILGVSGCLVLPFVKLLTNKKLVINIDGLEWKRDKWNKAAKLFLKYSEKLAVKYADEVVSDNKAIQQYVFDEYGIESHLIAYGADHVKKYDIKKELLNKYPFLEEKYAFKVCRIEPENNIHIVLEAFANYKDLPIVIVGNWDNSEYGKNLKDKYSNYKNIFLLDPIYDQKILNQIRSNCYVYIHGHSAGGTNPSLVEAMYLGLPIVAFNVIYNRETTQNKADYFVNSDMLIEVLKDINPDKLLANGKNMKEIALDNYVWQKIACKYVNLF